MTASKWENPHSSSVSLSLDNAAVAELAAVPTREIVHNARISLVASLLARAGAARRGAPAIIILDDELAGSNTACVI